MKKKIALIFAGCGKADGSEIHEATLTMLAINQQGADYQVFAPDITQYDVVNHLTGKPMDEQRNVLVESARIARGNIKNLSEYKAEDYDVLVIPGGFGAAKNLCSFAIEQEAMKVNNQVAHAIKSTHSSRKPIGALCISPVIIAKVLAGTKITVGQDENCASIVEKWGSKHTKTTHGEIISDFENKVVTTPCYMLDASISDIYNGTTELVKQLLKWT